MKALYFPHDCNAHEDMRIIELRMDYGWEAYGVFWAILEVMRLADNYTIPNNAKTLAFKFHLEHTKLQSIIDRCLELKLLTEVDNMLHCKELNERMSAVESRSASAKKAAQKRWSNADAMRTHSEGNAINKIKEKKIKEKETISKNTNRMFKNDDLYLFINFKKQFLNTKYENADLEYYHECVKNWADSKGIKKKDWAATARNFMLRDLKDGKLKTINKIISNEQYEYQQWLKSD
jgi:hypothetical protein|tara:strand:+ start:4203 stop:4907 length:705 start_codon:yes stop_codon:yes gene_type:complete